MIVGQITRRQVLGAMIAGISSSISPHVCDVIRAREFVATMAWASENITMPPGSEVKGKFNLDLFPHGLEVLEVYDDPYYRQIDMQWAARLGKTTIALACLAKQVATRPAPAAFSDADQKSLRRVMGRLWRILERVPSLEDKLPPPHLRSDDHVTLADCEVHGAWSGAPSTAADYGALLVILNEIDKMTRKKSSEADFAQLMCDRALGFKGHKIMRMSTPSRKGSSRIETARLEGDNRARRVPCPHCNYFQVLIEGNGRDPGGLRWEKGPDGHSHPDIAAATAWYECIMCRKKIEDRHRHEMMKAGIWVPEGMDIRSGRLVGKKARPGPHASFGPLSSLYSLLPAFSWGSLAKESVESRKRDFNSYKDATEKRRRFVNSIMGETWSDAPEETKEHELAARLCIPGQLFHICPDWVRFLTRGCDCGGGRGQDDIGSLEKIWWEVWGWGERGRCAMIDYGLSTPEELAKDLPSKANPNGKIYAHADGGLPLMVPLTILDSSYFTIAVYEYCRRFLTGLVEPCKGSSTSAFDKSYRISGLEITENARKLELQARLSGLSLFMVNTEQTQQWIEGIIRGRTKPEDPYGMNLPEALSADLDWFKQLCAEYSVDERNDNNYVVHTWKKRGNNEWRDAARYAFVAAQHLTKHGLLFSKPMIRRTQAMIDVERQQAQQRAQDPGLMTPNGQPWLLHLR